MFRLVLQERVFTGQARVTTAPGGPPGPRRRGIPDGHTGFILFILSVHTHTRAYFACACWQGTKVPPGDRDLRESAHLPRTTESFGRRVAIETRRRSGPGGRWNGLRRRNPGRVRPNRGRIRDVGEARASGGRGESRARVPRCARIRRPCTHTLVDAGPTRPIPCNE